ncbi:MAG: hypothetical protein D6820_02335, partial [Lentisphaerae bacterium]
MIRLSEKTLRRNGRKIHKAWLISDDGSSTENRRSEKIDISFLPPSLLKRLRQWDSSSRPAESDSPTLVPVASLGAVSLLHSLTEKMNPFRNTDLAKEEQDALLWMLYQSMLRPESDIYPVSSTPGPFSLDQSIGIEPPHPELLRRACLSLLNCTQTVLENLRQKRQPSRRNNRRRSRNSSPRRLYLYDVDSIYFSGEEKKLLKSGLLSHSSLSTLPVTSVVTDANGVLCHTDLCDLDDAVFERSVRRLEKLRKNMDAQLVICVDSPRWYENICEKMPHLARKVGLIRHLDYPEMSQIIQETQIDLKQLKAEWMVHEHNNRTFLLKIDPDRVHPSVELYREKFNELKHFIEEFIRSESGQNHETAEVIRLFKEKAAQVGIDHLVRFIRRNESLRPMLDRTALQQETYMRAVSMLEIKLPSSRWNRQELIARYEAKAAVEQAFAGIKSIYRTLFNAFSFIDPEYRFQDVSLVLGVIGYNLYHQMAMAWQKHCIRVNEGLVWASTLMLYRDTRTNKLLLPELPDYVAILFRALRLPYPKLPESAQESSPDKASS